ncbi:L-lysine 6-monooxygenase (NADPH-requiring)-domain-containing protein [Hygrophoropsis aurantiaca]|uniref:L-lysine 6-monooxygenase (NADPH-requiring)-domain-containing protein n=1 Tax=Hygrophoropsis aurantiaca TaxID=72124 RepID=A0ACB8ALW2_9AGAM|nr:L-lysine 6-monooxygenase (NADPH-requiring)-domain-containing protein [Hygrophoropsis aurantiaca]
MASSTQVFDREQIYDVIGLGFGPSNLAIAGAMVENTSSAEHIPLDKVLFIEKHDEFKWHPGMLLPGASMQIRQVSLLAAIFLKDLATLRSPQSPITFVSYLHSQNRLIDFINRGSTIPSRKEYSDYLSWAARYVQDKGIGIAYGEEVVALADADEGIVEVHSRNLTTGLHVIRRTKNLIISPGGSPRMPDSMEGLKSNSRIVHSSAYLWSIAPLVKMLVASKSALEPLRIAVLGSGQSAAEVLLDLHSRLSALPTTGRHELDMIVRQGSLKPSDDSPFANEVFNPASTGAMFGLPDASARRAVRAEYKGTNYGVVSPSTLESLYELIYDQKLEDDIARRTNSMRDTSAPYVTIRPNTNVVSAQINVVPGSPTEGPQSTAELISITYQHNLSRQVSEKAYDAVICATGYERQTWLRLLTASNIGKHFGVETIAPAGVRLAAESEKVQDEELELPELTFDSTNTTTDGASTPSTASVPSTPPTSPGTSSSLLMQEKSSTSSKLYISRNYRLIPVSKEGPLGGSAFKPRIYVQGCEEETHGLSDTLLSVLGVRAGEVVADLYQPENNA